MEIRNAKNGEKRISKPKKNSKPKKKQTNEKD